MIVVSLFCIEQMDDFEQAPDENWLSSAREKVLAP